MKFKPNVVAYLFMAMLFLPISELCAQDEINVPGLQFSDNACYAKYALPDQFETVENKVLVKAATNREKIVPAVYKDVEEQVLVTPAYEKQVAVPATFDYVEEQVLVTPKLTKLIEVPAVYETVTEKVLVKEESTRIVPIPAEYEIVTEKVLVAPEKKNIIIAPATYETITEPVEVSSPYSVKYPIPVAFNNVEEMYEIEPAYERVEQLTPEIEVITETTEIKPASSQWIKKEANQNCLSADPRDCDVWCLIEIPAEYQTVTKEINKGCDGSGIANSGCTRTVQVPAKMGMRNKTVLATTATFKTEMMPAEYATVTKTVLKNAATTKETVIPAVYNTLEKTVVKKAATYKEEKIPAEYKDVTKEVLVTPATTKMETIPAVYKKIRKKVVLTPATIETKQIPAVYKTIVTKKMVKPETVSSIPVPAEYKTVYMKQKTNDSKFTHKRIICEQDITDNLIKKIQLALLEKGFNPGPIDDIFGPKSKAALRKFQEANGLLAGHLDFETVNALGMDIQPKEAPNANGMLAVPEYQMFNMDDIAEPQPKEDVLVSKGNSPHVDPVNPSEKAAEKQNNASEDTPKKENDDEKDTAIKGASADEMAMIEEINLIRSNPKAYIKHIEAYIQKLENDELNRATNGEEISTAKELISELNNTPTLSILKPHDGLYQVGTKHGNDLKSRGVIEHTGGDGSWPWDRVKKGTDLTDGTENLVGGSDSVRESVIMLLVDSGIPNRGHRKALLNPKWNYVACKKVGKVADMPDTWVQMFGSK